MCGNGSGLTVHVHVVHVVRTRVRSVRVLEKTIESVSVMATQVEHGTPAGAPEGLGPMWAANGHAPAWTPHAGYQQE